MKKIFSAILNGICKLFFCIINSDIFKLFFWIIVLNACVIISILIYDYNENKKYDDNSAFVNKQISDNKNEIDINNNYNNITFLIKQTAQNGKYSITVKEIYKKNIDKLTSLKYDVSSKDDVYTISWKNYPQ